MRIASGSTDRVIYFVAVDATDLKTRETGLSGFTVYRSRNGGVATAYTSPTVTELSAANMPGLYALLIDEDTTIGSTHDTEAYVVHITHASMAPVSREFELYRPETTEGNTLLVDSSGIGDADLRQWLGSAPNALVSGRLDASVGAMANNVITAASIQADAITAPKVAADVSLEIAAAVWNADRGTYNTIGTFGEGVSSVQGDVTGSVLLNVEGNVSGNVLGNVEGEVFAIASGGIVAASFAAGAIDAAALAADAGTEIASAVWDRPRSSHTTAGSFGQGVASVQGNVTGSVGSVSGNVGGNVSGSVGSVASGGISSASFASGAITSSTFASNAISSSTLAADVATELRALASGTVDSGSTTVIVDAARTEADTDYWKGAYILFTSGPASGQCRLITAFDASLDTITWAPATTQAPVAGNTYEILPAARADVELWDGAAVNALSSGRVDVTVGAMQASTLTASALATDARDEIVDAVWDEARAGHTTSGSFGEGVNVASGGITSGSFASSSITAAALATDAGEEIADRVWDEPRAGHATAGTFGAGVIVDSLVTGAISAASIASAAANKIADHVIRRSLSSVQSSSDGDAVSFRSPLGAIRKLVNKVAIAAGTLTVYQEDDTTSAGTQAVTTDAGADAIVSVDTT